MTINKKMTSKGMTSKGMTNKKTMGGLVELFEGGV